MYVKRNYSLPMTFNWSKKPFLYGLLYALLIQVLQYCLNKSVSLPWQPISIIGIAVAFYLGFKNNSSYDRTWEARKIWGGIVNSSRAFSAAVVAFVQGNKQEEVKKELVYRHIAWLTALRHQLRVAKPWEHQDGNAKYIYLPTASESLSESILQEVSGYLSEEELQFLEGKSNMATQILGLQSKRLQELKDQGFYEDFRHMEFHHHLTSFYEDQGRAERIKNFPFPRQYASTALWLTFVFCALVPFGLGEVFNGYTNWVYWLSPLFSALVIWVFFLMEKIGDFSENPFEGSYNDVPITSIARGIEIDMLEMINDPNIPEPIKDENGFLM